MYARSSRKELKMIVTILLADGKVHSVWADADEAWAKQRQCEDEAPQIKWTLKTETVQ